MDYKYIDQLLERYWQCETSREEEEILRTFFSQKEVPAYLIPYKDLFCYEQSEQGKAVLGEDFDAKILAMIDEPIPVKARQITMTHRLMPLFKAAAVVAIILTLGNAAQRSFTNGDDSENDIDYASYKDTYSNPSAAYDKVENALQMVSEGINQANLQADSVKQLPTAGKDSSIKE
jgi:hypothetical protein